jgi:hypothetical protein
VLTDWDSRFWRTFTKPRAAGTLFVLEKVDRSWRVFLAARPGLGCWFSSVSGLRPRLIFAGARPGDAGESGGIELRHRVAV